MRSRNNTIIATLNVITVSQLGKLKELTHEMEYYNWHILGMCETRWKNSGEVQTDEGHKLYYSGEDDRHANGVGFLVHKSIQSAVLGCQPISSRIIAIRLRAKPLKITIIQVYAPTTDYDDEQIEQLYNQIQTVIDKVNKKDTLIIQGDWNAKVGVDAVEDWADYCSPSSNDITNDRGLHLLEFASINGMVLANTLGEHKPSRRYTWHAPNGRTRAQIEYIMVQNRYKSGVSRAKTRTFPGADIGSDNDLVIMTFRVRLKGSKKVNNTILKFNLDKLKDPNISSSFEARIGGKFGPPVILLECDAEAINNNFNEVMTEVATDILGSSRHKTQPWATDDILNMCDTRRLLKPQRKTPIGKIEHRKVNKQIKKGMKEATQKWIDDQCEEIEHSIATNNTKKAFQLVKTITKQPQSKVNNIQDKDGKCLTEG